MMAEWQTWAALGVVALAVVLLVRRAIKRRRGCGGDCGCGPSSRNRKH